MFYPLTFVLQIVILSVLETLTLKPTVFANLSLTSVLPPLIFIPLVNLIYNYIEEGNERERRYLLSANLPLPVSSSTSIFLSLSVNN